MSRSVTYRERDREWEEDSNRRTYTTVRRYQVPDTVTRATTRYSSDDEVKDKIVIKRTERREPSRERERDDIDVRITERVREREAPRDDYEYKVTERIRERPREEERRDVTYRVIERERERDSDHHSRSGRSDYRSEFKMVERERDRSSPSPERVREVVYERERSFSPPVRVERERRGAYDVERYSKSTEYFERPQPAPQVIIRESTPQPQIIIREERREQPQIIIRERRREAPRFEFIEETTNEQALVKRDDSPSPAPAPSEVKSVAKSVVKSEHKQEEEDYFYERRIREIDRRRRDDSHERRSEVRPRDSASQYGSEDDYEYYRREKTYERSRSRSHSPHHKRHLAEGAIAGIGAAEILRHHRRSEGKDTGGRLTSAVGGAAVGALGAEAITRFRSKSRRRDSRSRSRSWSGDRHSRYDRRRHHSRSRSRSRSRSKSMSRKQLGGLAAVAAVGALAGYALNKRSNNKETIIVNDAPRRSRSRRHRRDRDVAVVDPEDDKHRDPDHRNRRIAQAGVASAAAAGIWERMRSKSRHRSQSRLRTGVPIAAAGLGGAALAGLYEKNKASKEAKRDAIVQDEINRGRRHRSRSRSVPPSAYSEDSRRGAPVRDRGMIAYGNDPIPPRDYSDDEAPGSYRRRHRGGSSAGSSPDTRPRQRSRGREFAAGAAGAGLGAVAAHEYGQRRDRHHDDYAYSHDHGQDGYDHAGSYHPNQTYGHPQGGYQQEPYFSPPPTAEHAYQPYPEQPQNAYPSYNPQDYGTGATPPAMQQHPYVANRDLPNEGNDNAAGTAAEATRDAGHVNDEAHRAEAPTPQLAAHDERNGDGRRENPENVSATHQRTSRDLRGKSAAVEDDDGEEDEDGEGVRAGGRRRERGGAAPAERAVNGVGPFRPPALPDDETDEVRADGERTSGVFQQSGHARSSSRVRFDLDANEEHSPESRRKHRRRFSRDNDNGATERQRDFANDPELSSGSPDDSRHSEPRRRRSSHHSHQRSGSERRGEHSPSHRNSYSTRTDRDGARASPQLMHDPYERRPHTGGSASRSGTGTKRGRERGDGNGHDSDSTVDLPARFDANGNRKSEHSNASSSELGAALAKLIFGGREH